MSIGLGKLPAAATIPLNGVALPARLFWLRPTIRMKIACAFLAITLITLSLGLFASHSLGIAETLVVRTFDNALMSISYARASATDFANMQSVTVGLRPPGAADGSVLRDRMTSLSQMLGEDLPVAAERSLSPKAAQAAQDLTAAAAAWEAAAQKLIANGSPGGAAVSA